MRRWLAVMGLVVSIGLAYWAWPLVGAAQLARTARSGDAAAVFDRVDVDALRRSLARQIANAYLDVSGKGKKMGAFGRSLAGSAVTTVADPYVAQLLTPENVMALLAKGHVNEVNLGGRPVSIKGDLPDFSSLLDDHLLSAVTGSYFDQLKDFVIPVDGGHGADDQYGVHMHLVGLTWKLGGLDLPTPLLDQMARSILAGEPPAAL
ncbi:DUF2939 domain-containing protein [Lichenibacterium dinghuense]|uniref:DUF2939 domain-containing protein n=1 Tax=Lichenibacterium dinghuense TaxID=2895977 RepID=UPI001F458DB1|nr:DUF2939 domain-containing protein [Lichenibacterium sp. 6Y81]